MVGGNGLEPVSPRRVRQPRLFVLAWCVSVSAEYSITSDHWDRCLSSCFGLNVAQTVTQVHRLWLTCEFDKRTDCVADCLSETRPFPENWSIKRWRELG